MNLHFMVELQHESPRVMQAGMTATCVIGPCCIDWPVNAINGNICFSLISIYVILNLNDAIPLCMCNKFYCKVPSLHNN